jgi:hypothetical protein
MMVRMVYAETGGTSALASGSTGRLAGAGPVDSRASVAAIRLTSSLSWRRRSALRSDATSA